MTNTTNDATTTLIKALIEHLRGANDTWESLAMVIEFDGGELSGTYGYTYSPEGTVAAVASRPSGIRTAVTAYLSDYYKPGESLPVKILVQFERTSGEYEVTFEDTDTARWSVTPKNITTIREELRPQFS